MNGLLIALLVVLLPRVAQAANATPGEPVVQLSPYEVRANSVEFKHWIKIGSPNFILYTDARPADASAALREFEMLHFAGQVLFGRRASRFGPTVLILPTARSDWRKLEAKGDVEWKSAASAPSRRVVDSVVVQYDWQDEGLGLARAVFSFSDMLRMDIRGPFWFDRGFGLYYETADFDGDTVVLGHVSPRIRLLKDAAWIPWGRFFEVNPRSPEFVKEKLVGRYEAQASIFTQYLFSNSDRGWVDRLVKWNDYLATGAAPTEAQFQSIFGQDWKAWQRTMDAYLQSGQYNVFQVRTPADVSRFTEAKFNLPVREIRELFILTQILSQDVPESKTSLDALLAAGVQSEALRELLLEACLRWDRTDAAVKIVRELIAAGSTNPRVYRTGDALLTRYAGAFGLDVRYGSELAEVREWDRRGLQLEPLYADLNESMAENEACAPVIDQQSITTIEQCYQHMKGRAPTDRVIAELAMALWRIGDTRTASELAVRLRDDPLVPKPVRKVSSELVDRIRAGRKADSPPS